MTLIASPRGNLARRLSILIMCWYVSVALALAVAVVAPAIHDLKRGREEYQAMMSEAAREEEFTDAIAQVRTRLSMIRTQLLSHGARSLDDRVVHSVLREASAKAEMEIKRFESLKTAGEYSLTMKGAFANAVMFAADGLAQFDGLRIESFTVRGMGTPAHWIELHFSLKTTSYPRSPSERCLKN